MQSPFDFFRKNQKLMMVATIGLAMFGFVVAPAITDPANMSPGMAALFIACSIGGIAWVAGIRQKKSNEFGLVGFLAGLGVGLAAMMAVGPGDVVRADTGNINQMEMSTLLRQRYLANSFVSMAYDKAQENGFPRLPSSFRFGFGRPDETRDVVIGELLRREADGLGMEVTDQAVNDFILTRFDNKIGASEVSEIRDRLNVSESELYQSMRNEMLAFNAYQFFYGGITVPNGRNPLPPVDYWDFYRRMNIQESVGIAPLPVADFIDQSAQPSDSELQELFAEHRSNFPNETPERQLDEGAIGFHQPRRVALEYIEVPYDAIEKTVGEVTDEQVEEYYEEFYASGPDLPGPATEGSPPGDGPALPEFPLDDDPAAGDKPEMNAPGEEKPAETRPGAEEQPGAEPADDKPATPEPENKDQAEETPQEPSSKEPSEANEKPTEPESETPAEPESDDPPAEEGASLPAASALRLVAFFDDEEPAGQSDDAPANDATQESPSPVAEGEVASDKKPAEEAPAAENDAAQKPADETPAETPEPEAGDKPAAESGDKPTADTPADEKEMKSDAAPAEAQTPTEETPPAEPAGPPVLDDELRADIREQILRRRTSDEQQKVMQQVFEFMGIELSSAVTFPEDDEAHVSGEAATEILIEYAKTHGLAYDRTPLMSLRELELSEEYPVGGASSLTRDRSAQSAARIAFNMAPTSLYQARRVIDIETGSRFVFWKVEDVAAYIPESLDGPGIREQVVEAWRQLRAREMAMIRAEELAKQAADVDKPLAEVFAGATVTGKEGATAISIVEPPKFSWLSSLSGQVSPNSFSRPMPTLTQLRTVPGDLGNEFMRTVFDELKPGEAGVAHSFDKEYFYVVRVEDRTYTNSYGEPLDEQAFRERFASQANDIFDRYGFSAYYKLAINELAEYQTNFAEELFKRHNVHFAEVSPQDGEES